MSLDESPVLLYAHPSMSQLAQEIVDKCTSLHSGGSTSSPKRSVCIYLCWADVFIEDDYSNYAQCTKSMIYF